MKIRSIFAMMTAAVLLTGCSSGETAASDSESSVTSTADTNAAGGGSGSETEAGSDTGSVTPADTESSRPAVVPDDDDLPTTPEETTSGDTESVPTEPASTAAATTTGAAPVSTTSPETSKTTDTEKESVKPESGDYTGRDIGGTGAGSDDVVFGSDVDGFAEEAVCGEVADCAEGGAYAPECPPIEPIPGWDIQPEAGLLTGGEWNDNENWDFWKGLYGSNNYGVDWSGYLAHWRTGADYRAAVTVKDSSGNTVSGAKVTAGGYSAVTDNKGRAYLFFSEQQLVNGTTEFTVTSGESVRIFEQIVNGDCEFEFTLDSEVKPAEKTLDLMIMCDTTGSMSDELEYLKEELGDVVTRIMDDNGNIPTRISVNFYRDEGDEYVVREFPFTTDLGAAVGAISEQHAEGGGDTPEAVHTALESAIDTHDWDEDSVKIMFLVLDAPPHEDTQIIDETVKLVRKAAEKGIRIVPVAASGVDKSCEYLLRSMAFMTGGTYVFLTDDSGIGFGHTEPTIGSYNVEKLNDMMVRIVNGYLD